MSGTSELPSTGTWDGAASAQAARVAREFEAAYRSARGAKPDPRAFLPEPQRERPAVLLAILRVELELRHEAGERPDVEDYAARFPELDEDGVVALIYEDFCLREEAGDAPVPQEYEERFPDLTPRLRRIFDIHDLVGTGSLTAASSGSASEVAFPEVGETIAGFHLREELGRGSFARVFLAEERQLADRPVALKVSLTGSREPQTLARLQHTHIVPVHSHRIDPATDFHLLCMPFFGRITLERLLASPAIRTACSGADILAVLDRLDASGASAGGSARATLAALPFARALAWWGARMADALAHAHDRGVLHRDIKPSNVLITADGLPMLLDFNLAREPWDPAAREDRPGMLGGTLGYMAPEHLEAIAEGRDHHVDSRADLYSLGVLLFEALTGRRPFPPPPAGGSVGQTLRRAAEARRAAAPLIRRTHPEMPVALEAVIARCLDPRPERRHPDAAALAADLQAVADERPLPHTREPLSSRARRWVSRHRLGLTLTVPMLILASMLVGFARQAREDQSRLSRQIAQWIADGVRLESLGRPDAALEKYRDAAQLASEQPLYQSQPPLIAGYRSALAHRLRVDLALATISNARRAAARIDETEERLLEPVPETTARTLAAGLDELIASYESHAVAPRWADAQEFQGLTPTDARLLESSFERAIIERLGLSLRGAPAEAAAIARLCDLGTRLTTRPELWSAARAWILERRVEPLPSIESTDLTADDCLRIARIHIWRGEHEDALGALREAARRRPDAPLIHRRLAQVARRLGRDAEALAALDIARALRPDSESTRRERVSMLQALERWDDLRAENRAIGATKPESAPADR
ncbi:MAG: protein kinase [Isosphaeraceae bacterium]|nr:protein kinase [Isosphaeraceae bacterium]